MSAQLFNYQAVVRLEVETTMVYISDWRPPPIRVPHRGSKRPRPLP
jgi:hypothetical protein